MSMWDPTFPLSGPAEADDDLFGLYSSLMRGRTIGRRRTGGGFRGQDADLVPAGE